MRSVVITGASRGLGLEVARRFSELGCVVGLVARDAAALDAAAAMLPNRAHTAVADVAEPDQVRAAFGSLTGRLGPVDVLVNNAGHGHWGAVVDTPGAAFRRAVEVNYLGTVHATAEVLGPMVERGRGHIVNIASIAGRIGAPFEAAYSASKFAVVGYTEALQAEVAGSGVAVSLVDPGPIDTGFFARRGRPYDQRFPRPLPPAKVADIVVAVSESGGREVFVPRWLRAAQVMKTVAPPLHRRGIAQRYRAELTELRQHHRRP